MERYQEIERSIVKKYRKEIWRPFVLGVQKYDMIQEGDRIAVCISGGKDSMLLAKLLQELERHGKFHFGLEFLVMDPGYNPANRRRIEENAKILNIPIHIFESDIFDVVVDIKENPCYLCARMSHHEPARAADGQVHPARALRAAHKARQTEAAGDEVDDARALPCDGGVGRHRRARPCGAEPVPLRIYARIRAGF